MNQQHVAQLTNSTMIHSVIKYCTGLLILFLALAIEQKGKRVTENLINKINGTSTTELNIDHVRDRSSRMKESRDLFWEPSTNRRP